MPRPGFILVALLFSVSGAAQQQSHVDAATELLEAMHTEESLQETYDRVLFKMPEIAEQMGISEERQPEFEQLMEEMLVVVKETVTWEKMKPQLVTTYTEVFTESELRELADFYASPIGQKYVSKQPELALAAMEMTGEMMRELQARIKEIRNNMQFEARELPAEDQ